jgi:hypothetical protein
VASRDLQGGSSRLCQLRTDVLAFVSIECIDQMLDIWDPVNPVSQ